jgi:hypothetical protein
MGWEKEKRKRCVRREMSKCTYIYGRADINARNKTDIINIMKVYINSTHMTSDLPVILLCSVVGTVAHDEHRVIQLAATRSVEHTALVRLLS